MYKLYIYFYCQWWFLHHNIYRPILRFQFFFCIYFFISFAKFSYYFWLIKSRLIIIRNSLEVRLVTNFVKNYFFVFLGYDQNSVKMILSGRTRKSLRDFFVYFLNNFLRKQIDEIKVNIF